MRTTIACQYCRKAKIKCHHEGVAPCQACGAASRSDCLLSAPIVKGKSNSIVSTATPNRPRESIDAHSSLSNKRPRLASSAPSHLVKRVQPLADPVVTGPDLPTPALMLQACDLLQAYFPEFGFLHRPSFTDQLVAGSVDTAKLHAILSVTARFMPSLVSEHEGPEAAGNYYAARAESAVMARVLEDPDPATVQSLLLISIHHWGACNGNRAWMLAGIAIRMAQALRPKLTESKDADLPPKHLTSQECIRRTIWATFVVDCLLSGGKHRSQSFQAARLDLSLPMGEEDFTFESKPDEPSPHLNRLALSTIDDMTVAQRPDDCDKSLRLIIKGLDMWSTLSQWICDGGRRLEPRIAQSSPWSEESFWSSMKKALDCWRSSMSEKLHYSHTNSNLQAHIARNQGQPFVFINVIFHLNKLFLHREYIPFIPYRCPFPLGPIDPPLLIGPPPEGWWAANSTTLFASAASIIDLLRAAQLRGVEFKTVFVAFCVYSAAVTLLYAQAWPCMAPGVKPPHEDLQWALTWLDDTGALCKIVKGWRDTLSTVSVIYEHVKSADPSRFAHPGGHGLEDLEENINRLAEVPEAVASGREHAAEMLLNLGRQNRSSDSVQRIELHQPEIETGGQQGDLTGVSETNEFDLDTFIDPDLLASFMDGSMADMSQLPFDNYC